MQDWSACARASRSGGTCFCPPGPPFYPTLTFSNQPFCCPTRNQLLSWCRRLGFFFFFFFWSPFVRPPVPAPPLQSSPPPVDPRLPAAHPAPLAGRVNPSRAPGLDYDPTCYLCPGNARSGGAHTPITNASSPSTTTSPPCSPIRPARATQLPRPLAEPERGLCRVLCFHPNHSLTLARMTVPEIAASSTPGPTKPPPRRLPCINHVQIFENRGAMMGASNPHPHCQIWATEHIPDEPLRDSLRRPITTSTTPACSATTPPLEQPGARIVVENDPSSPSSPTGPSGPSRPSSFPAATSAAPRLHPRRARRPRRHPQSRHHPLRQSLRVPSPTPWASTSAHPRPGARRVALPRALLPAAAALRRVRKFMVGFEMFGSPQRDLTPETAAARLAPSPKPTSWTVPESSSVASDAVVDHVN